MEGLSLGRWWWSVATPHQLERNLPMLLSMYVWYAVGFAFYLSRVPERWTPTSRVSSLLSSHVWWHVCVFIAAASWDECGRRFVADTCGEGALSRWDECA